MSEDEQLHLLATNDMLVKQPIVLDEEYILVRFKEDEWNKLEGGTKHGSEF